MKFEGGFKKFEEECCAEKKERVEFLDEMINRDLYHPDVAGYRGISIEDIEYLVEHGTLPSKQAQEDVVGELTESNFYFFPRAIYQLPTSNLSGQRSNEAKDDEYYIEGAEDYARLITQRIEFCKAAGLSISDSTVFDLTSELGDLSPQSVTFFLKGPIAKHPDVIRMRESTGLTDDEVLSDICRKAYENTQKYKGAIVGLHKDIFKNYETHKGDDRDGDLYIRIPEGLDIKYISGLRLIGEGENKYFDEIKRKAKSQ